ncbi:hypothetical protein M885DRAFT_586933, partial [Pelagophyceae sp. CCMP2097]
TSKSDIGHGRYVGPRDCRCCRGHRAVARGPSPAPGAAERRRRDGLCRAGVDRGPERLPRPRPERPRGIVALVVPRRVPRQSRVRRRRDCACRRRRRRGPHRPYASATVGCDALQDVPRRADDPAAARGRRGSHAAKPARHRRSFGAYGHAEAGRGPGRRLLGLGAAGRRDGRLGLGVSRRRRRVYYRRSDWRTGPRAHRPGRPRGHARSDARRPRQGRRRRRRDELRLRRRDANRRAVERSQVAARGGDAGAAEGVAPRRAGRRRRAVGRAKEAHDGRRAHA